MLEGVQVLCGCDPGTIPCPGGSKEGFTEGLELESAAKGSLSLSSHVGLKCGSSLSSPPCGDKKEKKTAHKHLFPLS